MVATAAAAEESSVNVANLIASHEQQSVFVANCLKNLLSGSRR